MKALLHVAESKHPLVKRRKTISQESSSKHARIETPEEQRFSNFTNEILKKIMILSDLFHRFVPMAGNAIPVPVPTPHDMVTECEAKAHLLGLEWTDGEEVYGSLY